MVRVVYNLRTRTHVSRVSWLSEILMKLGQKITARDMAQTTSNKNDSRLITLVNHDFHSRNIRRTQTRHPACNYIYDKYVRVIFFFRTINNQCYKNNDNNKKKPVKFPSHAFYYYSCVFVLREIATTRRPLKRIHVDRGQRCSVFAVC